MGALGHGHQAVVRYIEETTAGTTPSNPALLLLSKETARTTFFLDKDMKESLDMGEIEVESFFSAKNIYGFEVEFHLYDVDRFFDFWERKSTGEPRSFTFELIPNEDAAVPHYIRAVGMRCQSATLSGRVGEAWVCSIVLTGGTIAAPSTSDPGIGSGSREAKAAITDALRTFAGGVITIDAVAAAVLVDEFEVTVEHGTEAHWTSGSAQPVVAGTTHGVRKISGTLNMSLDDGFKEHWDRVVAFADSTIVVPFSTTGGQPKVTFSVCKFPRINAETNVDSDLLMGSQPFSAETYAEGTV